MPTHTPRILRTAWAAAAMACLVACAPTTFTKTRIDWQPVEGSQFAQRNENVTVDAATPAETSPELYGDFQRCRAGDTLEFDKKGAPVMEKVAVTAPGQMWRRISITNHDDHVLRLNGLVIRMFTPDGREWVPLDRDRILSAFRSTRTCPSSANATAAFNGLRLLPAGVDLILPGSTAVGWLAFVPPDPETQVGVWKLGIYEMPVKTNDVGRTSKTARFEFRYKAVKFIDTYRQENFFAIPQLIQSVEATN